MNRVTLLLTVFLGGCMNAPPAPTRITLVAPHRSQALILDGGFPCSDPIRFHAYFATNGSDALGNGSITCPFATEPAAISSVATAPTSQAEYEQPRVIEALGPGTWTDAVTIPTLANVALVYPAGVKLGKHTWSVKESERHGSTQTATFYPIGPAALESSSIGDGADSIALVGDSMDVLSIATIDAANLNANGAITSDGVVVNPFLTLRSFFVTSSGTYAVDGQYNSPTTNGFTMKALSGSFAKEVRVGKLTNLDFVTFFQRLTHCVGGNANNLTTTGMRNVMFSSNATIKELSVCPSTPTRMDATSHWSLTTAGWSFDGGVLQLQE